MTNLINLTAKRVSNYYTIQELKKLSNKIVSFYPEQIDERRTEIEEVFKTYSEKELVNINNNIDKDLGRVKPMWRELIG